MDNYRFVYKEENDIFYGEIKNKRLIDYGKKSDKIEGNIYRGKIEKYIKSLDGFIVNIGLSKNALLRKKYSFNETKSGDDVLVEIIKLPEDDKLIEVTEKITLSDGYIVYSQYFKGKEYLLRTKGKLLTEKEIKNRYHILKNKFNELLKEKHRLPTPRLLLDDKFIRNYILDYSNMTVSNIKNLYNSIYDKKFNPKYNTQISLGLKISQERSVNFKFGNIFIDRLEALTVIDINSSGNFINVEKEKLAFKVNLESIEEIAIQINLRNIKKMLIIDFIRMNHNEEKILITKMISILRDYKLKFKILGFTKMGLFEMIVF